jgi:putative dimethyl sulfoxide reductase chaperone
MTVMSGVDGEVVEAAGRAVMYSLLSAGSAVPSRDRWSLLTSKLIPAALVIDLPDPLAELSADLASVLPADVDAFRDAHMTLFPPITSSDAPGYETAYRGDGIFQQTALLADIAGFYRAHGLRAGGTERERLDHITVELEFMAVLMRKIVASLQAGEFANAEICSEMAILFLRDHLGCWAPAYGRRVTTVSTSDWYRSLGALLTAWVELELDSEGVDPVEVVEQPLPFEPPDDGMCGPCGAPEAGAVS